jgi:hypothetical protein
VLDQYLARPEQVNVAVIAGNVLDRFLKAGYSTERDTEDFEELVPKDLLISLFPCGAHPFFGKGDGPVANLVPRQRHGCCMIANPWRLSSVGF